MDTKGPRQTTIWILVFAALGVPAAVSGPLTEWATSYPLRAFGCVLAWWLLIAIGALTTKIWSRRESKILAWIDASIDEYLVPMFFPRRRVYCKYIEQKCAKFRNEGIISRRPWSFHLDEIFVDLRLIPRNAADADTAIVPNSFQIPSRGRLKVWELLDRAPDNPLRLVVLGGPGTGKSTLLEHIALRLATRHGYSIPSRLKKRIPILLQLRGCGSLITANPSVPLHLIAAAEFQAESSREQISAWIRRQLHGGRAITMIDGLDELAEPHARVAIVSWITRQITAYPNCAFILTSRPGGYRENPLEAVELVTEVEPFTAEQVRNFIYQWFVADTWRDERSLYDGPLRGPTETELEERVRFRAPARAEEFFQRLRRVPAHSEFAGNPLLLHMMAELHAAGGVLGERRAELYDEMMKLALGRRRQSKGLTLELGIEQKLAVIQPLALAMLERNQLVLSLQDAALIIEYPLQLVRRDMSPHRFLESIVDDAGVLVAREVGMLAFAHTSFTEYLAARELGEYGGEFLIARIDEDFWQETILFWSSMFDPSMLVSWILSQPHRDAAGIELALRIAAVAKSMAPDVSLEISTLVQEAYETVDPAARTVIATALLSKRLKALRPVDSRISIDDGLISNIEYQLFLDESRIIGEFRQPDHWIDVTFPRGCGHQPAMGVRFDDAVAFCEWLNQRQGGGIRYRLPTELEVSASPSRSGLDSEFGTYWTSGGKLADASPTEIGDEKMRRHLRFLLRSDEISPELLNSPVEGHYLGVSLFEWRIFSLFCKEFTGLTDRGLGIEYFGDLISRNLEWGVPLREAHYLPKRDPKNETVDKMSKALEMAAKGEIFARCCVPRGMKADIETLRNFIRLIKIGNPLDSLMAQGFDVGRKHVGRQYDFWARGRGEAIMIMQEVADTIRETCFEDFFIGKDESEIRVSPSRIGNKDLCVEYYGLWAIVYAAYAAALRSNLEKYPKYVTSRGVDRLYGNVSVIDFGGAQHEHLKLRRFSDVAQRYARLCAACLVICCRIVGTSTPKEGVRIVCERGDSSGQFL